MQMKRNRGLSGFAAFFLVSFLWGCGGCSGSKQYAKRGESNERILRRPPAAVEKAWLARHQYDPERRLLVPRYSGARWGSILEYTEDENLVYRDWWIRDLKMEDLDAEPNTRLVPFSQMDGGLEKGPAQQDEDPAANQNSEQADGGDFFPFGKAEDEALPSTSAGEDAESLPPAFDPLSPLP